MTRILLVNDHPVVVEGLKHILAGAIPDVEFGVAGGAAESVRMFRSAKWHMVVLEAALPDGNGLDVLKQMRANRPRIPVLVISRYPEDQFAVRLLRAGAAAQSRNLQEPRSGRTAREGRPILQTTLSLSTGTPGALERL